MLDHSTERRPATATAASSSTTSIEAMLASKLSEELQDQDAQKGAGRLTSISESIRTPSKSPSKTRSLSDSTPKLSPSPNIKERSKTSRDDQNLHSDPRTPRRSNFLARGLSLQMPTSQSSSNASNGFVLGPLSPKIDQRSTYGSPASVLPRHSRGLDFSRACTNLHHSTLAEASSPDSSPIVNQKAIPIPTRAGLPHGYLNSDSPHMGGSTWVSGIGDRSVISGSLSSVNMLDSSDSDSDGGSIDPDEADDIMISTPQAARATDTSATTPFPAGHGIMSRPFWPNKDSPGPSSFMNFQRARLRHRRSRHSSSSASGHSSLASPIPQSPPNGRADAVNGYFAREMPIKKPASRRESLSIGTRDLHISSGNDSGDEAGLSGVSTPGVVQRPVTRRGSLLPKSRAFGRIRAELMEESAPLDTDVRREAEVIRQVREGDQSAEPSLPPGASSPVLPTSDSVLEGIPEDNPMGIELVGVPKNLFGAFSRRAFRNTNSGGKDFWNTFDKDTKTPPAPSFTHRSSDDMAMDSPTTTSSTPSNSVMVTSNGTQDTVVLSRASTPHLTGGPTAADGIRKANKRRRDDDLDGMSMKRRAVSPGMSVQNSPILSQSPNQREMNLWGQPVSQNPAKLSRESSVAASGLAERSNSNGSSTAVLPNFGYMGKRVGLQGMTDTSDGLMKMSIE